MRIGRLSRLWPTRRRREADECRRCRTSFVFSPAKSTIVESPILSGVRVVAPLCCPCWRDLSPAERLRYYRELWIENAGPDPAENAAIWTAIEFAVGAGG